jgi:acyl carrier protein
VLDLNLSADQIRYAEPLYSSLIGLDSSGLLKTIIKAEKQYNIEINDEDIMESDLETIEDLANLIFHKLS